MVPERKNDISMLFNAYYLTKKKKDKRDFVLIYTFAGSMQEIWPNLKLPGKCIFDLHFFCFVSNAVFFNPLKNLKFLRSLLSRCLILHQKFYTLLLIQRQF